MFYSRFIRLTPMNSAVRFSERYDETLERLYTH